jgi:hypothetical protein
MLEGDKLLSVMLFAIRGKLIIEFLLVCDMLIASFVAFR